MFNRFPLLCLFPQSAYAPFWVALYPWSVFCWHIVRQQRVPAWFAGGPRACYADQTQRESNLSPWKPTSDSTSIWIHSWKSQPRVCSAFPCFFLFLKIDALWTVTTWAPAKSFLWTVHYTRHSFWCRTRQLVEKLFPGVSSSNMLQKPQKELKKYFFKLFLHDVGVSTFLHSVGFSSRSYLQRKSLDMHLKLLQVCDFPIFS